MTPDGKIKVSGFREKSIPLKKSEQKEKFKDARWMCTKLNTSSKKSPKNSIECRKV